MIQFFNSLFLKKSCFVFSIAKCAVYFYLLLVFSEQVQSQQKTFYFNSFTSENGLSQNSVISIVQDNKGLVWVSTENGLHRFDGYNFVQWIHEIDNDQSLPPGVIYDLAVDKLDRIWTATSAGLSCFDPDKNAFFSLNKSIDSVRASLSNIFVYTVFIDSRGYLWLGTRTGVYKSDRGAHNIRQENRSDLITFSSFRKDKNGLNDNSIKCIKEDRFKQIWFGTDNGLNRYNQETNEFDSFYFSTENTEGSSENEIRDFEFINDSILWVGTKAGLFELNVNTGQSVSFSNHPFFIKNNIMSEIRSLYQDKNNNIWIGTFGNGLIQFDNQSKSFYSFSNTLNSKQIDSFIFNVFQDESGTLFIGTQTNGLLTANLSGNYFELFQHNTNENDGLSDNFIRTVTSQDRETVWIGTQSQGLEKFNPVTKEFIHYPFEVLLKNQAAVSIECIVPKNKNEIWIGTRGAGLLVFNHKSRETIQLLPNGTNESISDKNIQRLVKQGDSILWIGTHGSGIDMLNLKTNRYTHFDADQKDSTKLSSGIITELQVDKDNNLWIGTLGGGIMRLNTQTFKISHFRHKQNENSISSDLILDLHIDNSGAVWAGTSAGLNKIDIENNLIENYGKNIGFSDEFINCVEEDRANNIWLGTNLGLIKFNKNTREVYQFDVKDGLQSNEFNTSASDILHDGGMVFGGIKGFNLFYPEEIKPNEFQPEIIITDFLLFNKSVLPNTKYSNGLMLNKCICNIDSINLSYRNKVIGFKFTSSDFSNPDKVKFEYRLKGFEESWNSTNHLTRYTRYTNLDYGLYTLQIRATNSDGIWSSKTKELMLNIKAPFWRTNTFQTFIILFVALLGIITFRVRTNLLKKQKRILEKLVKERTEEISNKNFELQEKYEEIVVQEEEIREQAEELRALSEKLQELNNSLAQKVKERTIELEMALDKSEDSQKLISSFLSNLSHEIRTPLNAILGFSGVLTSEDYSKAEKEKYGNFIKQNVNTFLRQIDNILDLSRLHSGLYQINESTFSLYYLCQEIYNEFSKHEKVKNGDTKIELLSEYDVVISSDPEAFKAIVYNLVENSVKFIGSGNIKIEFELSKKTPATNVVYKIVPDAKAILTIVVSDTGIGIPDKMQAMIFEPFRKIEEDSTKLYRGSGVGLSLVNLLTKKLSGKIELQSEVNKGTTFKLFFPVHGIY